MGMMSVVTSVFGDVIRGAINKSGVVDLSVDLLAGRLQAQARLIGLEPPMPPLREFARDAQGLSYEEAIDLAEKRAAAIAFGSTQGAGPIEEPKQPIVPIAPTPPTGLSALMHMRSKEDYWREWQVEHLNQELQELRWQATKRDVKEWDGWTIGKWIAIGYLGGLAHGFYINRKQR
jgi:hypothetical protein